MRKLASVQVVKAVTPIPWADRLEVLEVLGWKVVAQKGEFSVGDKVIYCEVDSLLPERPEFEFLRTKCYKPEHKEGGQVLLRAGFRIKTIKLKGQVSQGIVFPMSILGRDAEVGDDVSEALGVIKYDPPVPAHLAGKVKGNFPEALLPKTDETRVQLLEDLLVENKGKALYYTEKVDGASTTIAVYEDQDYVCSRNLRLDENDQGSTICQLVQKMNLLSKLRDLRERDGVWYAIQAEILGPGIQKNRYALKDPQFRVFNLLALRGPGDPVYLGWTHLQMVARYLGLETVPYLGSLTLNHSVDDLVELSKGRSTINPKVHREGVVLRTFGGQEPYGADRVSFKAINPDFLLKYDE